MATNANWISAAVAGFLRINAPNSSMAVVRQRRPHSNNNNNNNNIINNNLDEQRSQDNISTVEIPPSWHQHGSSWSRDASWRLWVLLMVFGAGLVGLSLWAQVHYPPVRAEHEAGPDEVSGARVLRHTREMCALGGPRLVGSEENEVLAPRFVLARLDEVRRAAGAAHRIEAEVQTGSGSFHMDFLGGMSVAYRNVQNVVARMSPASGDHDQKSSILVSCHYDSAIASQGASDDAASCMLMIEVLRLLSRSPEPFLHSIIMVFTGGEESFMTGSHLFITRHRWAPSVRTFINLDSAGTGGQLLLFQAGPGQPWLMEVYARAVPAPHANTIAQEVFQTGVLPSDTDFRVYRDFGNLSGMDLAYARDGFSYHTRHDVPDNIPVGSLQSGGENLRALVREMANAEEIHTRAGDGGRGAAGVVFFDVLGVFMVSYPWWLGLVVSCAAVCLNTCRVYRKYGGTGADVNGDVRKMRRHLTTITLTILSSMLTSLLLSLATATLLTLAGRSLSWLGQPLLLPGLYVCPVLASYMLVHARVWRGGGGGGGTQIEDAHFDTYTVLISILLLLFTLSGSAVSLLPLLWLVFPVVVRCYVLPCTPLRAWFHAGAGVRYLVVSILLPCLVPNLLSTYFSAMAVSMLVPVMVRTGVAFPPDLFVGTFLITGATWLNLSYHYGLLHLSSPRTTTVLRRCLMFLHLTSLLLALLTPAGFPYSPQQAGTGGYQILQRHYVVHATRHFHATGSTRDVSHSDASLLHVPFDYHTTRLVRPYLPELAWPNTTTPDCRGTLYCLAPHYAPIVDELPPIPLIPLKQHPVVRDDVGRLTLTSRERVAPRTTRYTLDIRGPDHMTLVLSAVPRPRGLQQHRVTAWSLTPGTPTPTKHNTNPTRLTPTYFISYSHGRLGMLDKWWRVWVEVEEGEEGAEGEGESGRPLLELGLTSHYLRPDQGSSKQLDDYVEQFPEWTTVGKWVAIYNYYKI